MRQYRQRWMWFDETQDALRNGEEIFVDCFAGGGGASLGIKMATGRAPDVAINHDKAAIAMHLANHPETHHYCENLWDVDPEEVTDGRPVGAAWFSPDCTHHSKAKGNKPKDGKMRALAWIVLRWAARVRPRVIFLENVEEFVTWAPLDEKGNPIEERKGETFRAFTAALECGVDSEPDIVAEMREYLGEDIEQFHILEGLRYKVEWKVLVASNYGSPTTRKRLFLIARCDGEPIVWPAETHGSPKEIARRLKKYHRCNLQKWRTAAEIIDWDLPCPSIFCTREEAKAAGVVVQRPLKEKTLKRIAEGIRRYVIDNPNPFIVNMQHGGKHFRGQPLDLPLSTVTQKHGYGLVTPYVVGAGGPVYSAKPVRLDQPFGTVMKDDRRALVAPYLAALQNGGLTRSIDSPTHTITASRKDCNLVVAPALVAYYGPREGDDGHRGRSLDMPLATQTTENRFALLAPTLVQTGYGERPGQSPRCLDIHRPLGTAVAGGGKHALVSAFIAKHFGGMVGIPAFHPFPTITTRGTQNQLVAATLIKNNHGGKQAFAVDEPLRTIVSQGTHHAVVQTRVAEVRAFLMGYYGNSTWSGMGAPCPTITVKDRLALGIVLVGGEPFQIVDIGMRMLTPRELFRAQGFPDSYRIDVGLNGKPATKSEQVGRCGNSVCPQVVSAVVRANYSSRRVEAAICARAARVNPAEAK
ncbi:MAG: DNA cytosine methyltransferase [Planctomycetaceae bacterium]|nr:DNA cytosine methyltransferase [Planctomycetaceae bacterium]